MLVLQQLFNLSDEEVEFQVNDRRSFEEFVGLGVMNDIPDATTVAFFRELPKRSKRLQQKDLDARWVKKMISITMFIRTAFALMLSTILSDTL